MLEEISANIATGQKKESLQQFMMAAGGGVRGSFANQQRNIFLGITNMVKNHMHNHQQQQQHQQNHHHNHRDVLMGDNFKRQNTAATGRITGGQIKSNLQIISSYIPKKEEVANNSAPYRQQNTLKRILTKKNFQILEEDNYLSVRELEGGELIKNSYY